MEQENSVAWQRGLIFVVLMWLMSRIVAIAAIQLIAPSLSLSPVDPPKYLGISDFVPTAGWELFSHWDGLWYKQIVTEGYTYAPDSNYQYPVAFFPLYPLLVRSLMFLGLRYEAAGILVNNFTFLGALFLLYQWAAERYSPRVAQWSTAVMAWCPFALFCTVTYTEGLFLLCTTGALYAFERRRYAWAGFWGMLSTATRVPGGVLLPTFFFVAWREKRKWMAYVAGLAVVLGLLFYMLYCALQFGEPLAFLKIQQSWPKLGWGLGTPGKLGVLGQILNFRTDPGSSVASVIKAVMVLGGAYLLWFMRRELTNTTTAYGFFSIALILFSGTTNSVHRYSYGIVSLSLALGILLSRHPRWGYGVLGVFAIGLAMFSVRFAWWQWVA